LPWQEQIDDLLATPGVDPILSYLEGGPDCVVPEQGYLISATMWPGVQHGSLNIHRYGPGSLKVRSVRDDRELHGETAASVVLSGCSLQTILIGAEEPPIQRYYSAGNREMRADWARTHQIPDGPLIVTKDRPYIIEPSAPLHRTIVTRNPYSGEFPTRERYPLEIQRAVADQAAAEAVIRHLAAGIGLQGDQLEAFARVAAGALAELPEGGATVMDRLAGWRGLHWLSSLVRSAGRRP
jgi:hypothetical protein